ncbi:SDR family NAD(P)-dependent oxidoreductase [Sediminivirga luteola]|uniref:2,5-dichloro-2,5-cyclohexadiene-1,4-diol dehydrogenase n=1 Tax=Sediminivirga luteola TaxID=1774748 RepID=A0A8J2TZY0_9MICO|nr:glucose 1-dehydrogenase [Sediminivirga luteola]GGA21624.1 2,5-dichloro-2,5-cyclohexadiene-1,4-diol dehydrogenase [Sediminivirga luteola]
MTRLTGKVAIVTGASRGIGAGIATAMAAEGATVIGCDVLGFSAPALAATEALDVTDEDAWAQVVAKVLERTGRLDVLVNNAGITSPESVHESRLEEWRRVVSVNQTGVFFGMRAAIPAMEAGGGGAIINISSICGAAAVPGIAAYHAAKGAVRTMTKNAAITYARQGIRANAILPGWIQTPMTAGQSADVNDRFLDATPLGRPGTPSDVAGAAVFLASDESAFITGVDLPVDGGYLAA